MYSVIIVLLLILHLSFNEEVNVSNVQRINNPKVYPPSQEQVNKRQVSTVQYVPVELTDIDKNSISSHGQSITLLPPIKSVDLHTLAAGNPLLAALLLSYSLGITPESPGFNHPLHLPTNPYVALLLSHYGRYIPAHGFKRGIYGYAAANNYHNNLPFGAYKIYEDRDV